MTFEQAFQELEEIVRQLEGGQPALDEALALFERGQALAARCGALLDSAELKVRQLVPKEGGYELEDFEEAEA
jgi:exodeoxyribonuclease VII small subunit